MDNPLQRRLISSADSYFFLPLTIAKADVPGAEGQVELAPDACALDEI